MKFSLKKFIKPKQDLRLDLDKRLAITWRQSLYFTFMIVVAIIVAHYLLYLNFASTNVDTTTVSANPNLKQAELEKIVIELNNKAKKHSNLLLSKPVVIDPK